MNTIYIYIYIGVFQDMITIFSVMQWNVTLQFAVTRIFSRVERNISFLWTSTLSRLKSAEFLAR